MASRGLAKVVQRLKQAAMAGGGGLSDGQLLQRYISHREEEAFTALVKRHGPMVLSVCRRLLRNAHDADDAFQATFLVLIRKAPSVLPRDRVGHWLYGVAYRTALKAKTVNYRRRAQQEPLFDQPAPAPKPDAEWLALLDQEISRLPEKYRLPIVLCDLGGKTRKEAARLLGWPEGTVATRLQHGRSVVQKRLTRHGLPLLAGASVLGVPVTAKAFAPPELVSATVNHAILYGAGKGAGLIPLKIVALAEGVLKAMTFAKCKTLFLVLVVVGVIGLGTGGLSGRWRLAAVAQTPAGEPRKASAQAERPEMTQVESPALPTGPAPIQALVKFDKSKGEVIVQTAQTRYVPRTAIVEESDGKTNTKRNVTFYEKTQSKMETRYLLKEVKVYDMQLHALDITELADKLQRESPALLFTGTKRDIDPLHLRLYKNDTLLFVVPATVGELPGVELPAAVPAFPAVPPPPPMINGPMAPLTPQPSAAPAAVPPDPNSPNPPSVYVKGRIDRVDPRDRNLVQISIGTDQGIKQNHTLVVYRVSPEPAYLGMIRIRDAKEHSAVGQLMSSTAATPRLQPGDIVASSIMPPSP